MGQSQTGPYEVLVVQAPGSSRQPTIAIKPTKRTSIGVNGVFKIDRIISVTHRKWKDSSGHWHDGKVNVYAKVTPISEAVVNPDEPIEVNYSGAQTEFPSLEDFFK